jgi:ABC-2 type transport system ATP-binding protein
VLERFGEVRPGEDGNLRVSLESGAGGVAPVVRALDEAGVVVASLELLQPTLDDVFVAKTGHGLKALDAEDAAA